MNHRLRALTTGQAARCCFVTPDTIVNWIKAGLLHAQKTAGGRYRILLDELRRFMQAQGMTTRLLDHRTQDRLMCWQFHAQSMSAQPSKSHCDGCLVKYLGVLNCFKLMAMRPSQSGFCEDCQTCPYYLAWGVEPKNLRSDRTTASKTQEERP